MVVSIFPLNAQESAVSSDNVKYDIAVELDHGNRMLKGAEIIEWYNHTNDEISDIWFHLYWNAFKNEQSAMAREVYESNDSGVRFSGGFRRGKWGWVDVDRIQVKDGADLTATMEYMTVDRPVRQHDQTVMRVKLPEALKPGETIVLEVDFTSKIPRTIARSGYYHNSYFIGQWFPKPGVYEEGKGWNCHQYHQNTEFYADYAEFKVDITVPEEFVVGATGVESGSRENPEKKTVTYTYKQNRVHDFAWTADPDYIKLERMFIADEEVSPEEYAEVARALDVPLEEVKIKDVKMILLINPEHRDQIDRHFKALSNSIKYYGLWYGLYPYDTATLLDPPYRNDCGGMEYPTLSTAGTSLFPSDQPISPEFVSVHEFGHNFWYGLIGNNEFEEAWIDEGINSYSDGKVIAAAYGEIQIPMFFNGIPVERYTKNIKLEKFNMNRLQAIISARMDPIMTEAWKFISPMSYGANVYGKAATCLETLERIVGNDMMLRILRRFQMTFRYKHPNTADFINVVNQVTGRNFQWFFDELFYKANAFDYGVSSVKSRRINSPVGIFDQDGEKVEIKRRQAAEKDKEVEEHQYESLVKVNRFGEATLGGDVMLQVKVVFEDESVETRQWDGKARWTSFRFVTSSKVKYAVVDPDTQFLVDVNISNNSLKREADRRGALRIGNKVLFWFQNLLQAVTIVS
jgi:hypothetical protein